MEQKLFFEELETVEEMGWIEAGVGILIGGALGVIVYIGIAT